MTSNAPGQDRRGRRRAATIAEILDIAVELMTAEGVGGLSLSAIARRMGIQPPSLYKYFGSRHAVYDALFKSGQERYLAAIDQAIDRAEPGLAALGAAFEAGSRWVVANQALAQLMFWRPVPGFVPSEDAYGPAVAIGERMTGVVQDAVRRGELHPDAAGRDGLNLLRSLIAGVLGQQLSNEPEATFEEGSFTRLVVRLPGLFAAAYPP